MTFPTCLLHCSVWSSRAVRRAGLGLSLLLATAGCNSMHGQMNNQVGSLFYKTGNYAHARSEFQRAVANDPYNADYMHNLGMAMRRQGDVASAENVLRRAITVDPGHQPSYHGLAMILKDQNRSDEAIDVLQAWADQQPYKAESHIELAWMQRETGNYAGAEQSLRQALQARPNDSVATAHLGQLYQDTNQPEKAVAMYRRSLYSNWYQPEVQSRLATLQQQNPQAAQQNTLAMNSPLTGPAVAGPQPTVAAYYNGTAPFAAYPLPTYQQASSPMTGSGNMVSSDPSLMPIPSGAAPTIASPSYAAPGTPGLATSTIVPTLATNPQDGLSYGGTPVVPVSGTLQPIPDPAATLGGDAAHGGDMGSDIPVVQPH